MSTSLLKSLIPQGLLRRRLPVDAGNSVLLTFDDGPTPGVTEGVLDLLDRYGARAIFFLVGNHVAKAPGLPVEILRRGHQVGHHSLAHDARRWQSPIRWWRDMSRCCSVIEDSSGIRCRFYRAPEGRLSPLTLLGPPLAGMQHILWSLDSRDWACPDAAAARELARDVDRFTRARDIILCHDFSPDVHVMLEELLPRLVDRGFDLAGGVDSLKGTKS